MLALASHLCSVSLLKDSYLMGVDPYRYTKSPSQAKICQFDNSLVINKEVLRFQVTMEDTSTVTEVNALQDLVKVALKCGEGRNTETHMRDAKFASAHSSVHYQIIWSCHHMVEIRN